jgi:hypothetical protein
MYKNPRVKANLTDAITLGGRCTGRKHYYYLPVSCEAALPPATSHLEGVGNHYAACAATTFVHYTPPPFVALIVHCISDAVKPFLKIHLKQVSGSTLWNVLASEASGCL